MNLKQDRILIELQIETISPGGIILGSANLEKHQGKVLAIGPEVKHVQIDNNVRFDPNSSIDYEHEGKKCVFVRESNTGLMIL